MELYIIWAVIALILIGAEMMLASVYLIAFFLGALSAAALAYFDCSLFSQCMTGSAVIIAGVILAYLYRKNIRKLNVTSDLDSPDSGKTVFVKTVNEDGSAKVNYRGTIWTAFKSDGQKLTQGQYIIDHIEGTRLILK